MSHPFMQLYVADYLGDTRHLTTEQHGAYLLILMTMWRAGGYLPNDDAKLARIAGLTAAKWRKISPDILAMLTVDGDQITQARLLKEIENANEKSLKRSEAGKLGVAAKSLKNNNAPQANAEPLLKHSSEPEPDIYITIIDAGAHVDQNDWARMLAEATAAAGDQLDQTSTGVKHAADLRALVEPHTGQPCLWSEVIAAIGMVRTRSERTRKPIRSWSWIRDDAIKLRDIRLSADLPGVNQSNIIGGGYDGFNGNRAATPTVGETRRAGAALALDRLRSSQSGGDDDGGGYPRLAVIS